MSDQELQKSHPQSHPLSHLEKLAEEVCQRESCFLYALEFVGQGQGRVLRVFIDKAEGGAGIDDCSKISRGFNEILDADEELIPGGNYHLEVSTPGLERILQKPWHFQKVVGKKIWVKLASPLEKFGVSEAKYKITKQFDHLLSGADDQGITFEFDLAADSNKEAATQTVKIPFDQVEKAKLVFEMPSAVKADSGKKPARKKMN